MKKTISVLTLALFLLGFMPASSQAALPDINLRILWGNLQARPYSKAAMMNGSIETTGGLTLLQTVAFDGSGIYRDRVITISNQKIVWKSFVAEGYDGVQVKIIPTSLEQIVNINIGGTNKSYKIRDLINIKYVSKIDSAGHMLSIKQYGKVDMVKTKVEWGRLDSKAVKGKKVVLWSGTISFIGADSESVGFTQFEGNDSLVCTNGCKKTSSILVNGYTNQDRDSLYFSLPAYDDTVTARINLTSNAGNYDKTFTIAQLKTGNTTTLDSQGNGVVVKQMQ